MMKRHILVGTVALCVSTTPAFGQGHQHPAPAAAGQGQDTGAQAMICTMGMLPHPGMGGMMGEQGMGGMQHGAMAGGGMQDGAMAGGGMQHGAMAGLRRDSAHAGAMQHGAMGQPGAAGMAQDAMPHPVTPTMLLHHATELALTAEQQSQVTQLAESSQASCRQHLELATKSHQAATAALQQNLAAPDVTAYESRLREASAHVLDAHVAVVKAGAEAAALLSADQKEKLAATARMEHR